MIVKVTARVAAVRILAITLWRPASAWSAYKAAKAAIEKSLLPVEVEAAK